MKLQILGQAVEVIVAPFETDDGIPAAGQYRPDEKLIEIDPDEDYWRVLLHEVTHALFDRIHFEPGELLEEVLCDTLAKVLTENFALEHRGDDGDRSQEATA